MEQNIAIYLTGVIIDENHQFYFLQKEGRTYALAKSEGKQQIGESVRGVSYLDKQQRWRVTTRHIVADTKHYGWGEVIEVRRDLGVFVDIGLADKQIAISLDQLPTIKELWPQKGDQLYIRLEIDKKNRVWGIPADEEVFQRLARPAYDNMQNQTWPAIVYRPKLSGSFVYLPQNNMLGFIHPSQRYQEPRLGQSLSARVIGFRKENRTLNLSLKPRSFEMIENDAQMILTYLKTKGGYMTLNDKSPKEDIQQVFGISKGQFKKALGNLMKSNKIRQSPSGTELLDE